MQIQFTSQISEIQLLTSAWTLSELGYRGNINYLYNQPSLLPVEYSVINLHW